MIILTNKLYRHAYVCKSTYNCVISLTDEQLIDRLSEWQLINLIKDSYPAFFLLFIGKKEQAFQNIQI